jgi:hypothetical protein
VPSPGNEDRWSSAPCDGQSLETSVFVVLVHRVRLRRRSMLTDTITHDDAARLLRALQYARPARLHDRVSEYLARTQGTPSPRVRWIDMSPAVAALPWEEVVWLRQHFDPAEQAVIEAILTRLAGLEERR